MNKKLEMKCDDDKCSFYENNVWLKPKEVCDLYNRNIKYIKHLENEMEKIKNEKEMEIKSLENLVKNITEVVEDLQEKNMDLYDELEMYKSLVNCLKSIRYIEVEF